MSLASDQLPPARPRIHRRRLIIGLAAAGAFGAGLGAGVMPAEADPRTFVVTLVGGKTITVTVDVPPGTPVDQVTIPNVSTPIVGISEVTPEPTPTTTTQATEAPAEPASAAAPKAGEEPKAEAVGSEQKTARKKRKRAEEGDTAELLSIVKGAKKERAEAGGGRNDDGTPTLDNPTFTLATPGAARIGVPNFMIEKFRIPPFLLPIYQAAGVEYGIRWEVLAAINEIETDYGRNLNVSSAGALGWMQFMPATWKAYGVDANKDGVKDPYNPVDAIFAAARYLRAAGAETDLARAIFAYNHADWYVDSVLMRARVIGGLPSNLVASLTGLTQGRFPVQARATYADDLSEGELTRRKRAGSPAWLVQAKRRRGITVYARAGASVVAVNDGKIVRMGRHERLGRFIQLQDVYGNTYTYGHLNTVSKVYEAREPVTKERLFASSFRSRFGRLLGLKRKSMGIQSTRLKPGSKVVAGTILGQIGADERGVAPHLLFEIRPAGRGAPRIDPKPILDGWKLLESTAIYRAAGKNPFHGPDALQPSIGQILLMSKEALQRRVLSNPRIEVYDCGRRDLRLGIVDRRVLATLEFLAASGFRPTVTSLRCGHSYYTKGGNVSHHSSGNAVDIAKLNGVPVLGHQGAGSITELAVQRLLTLQGLMKPDQIITLMTFENADNTFAMSDHHDHIHVGWRPLYGTNSKAAKQVDAILKPKQWIKLVDRLKEIDNPTVRLAPSKYSVKDAKRASRAHDGE